MNSKAHSGRRRLVLRVLAWLLVVIGFLGAPIVAFGFILYVQPFRDDYRLTRVANFGINSHEAWQSRIRRLRVAGWMHGDFGHIGQLAGKSTLRRVIERVKPGDDIESCSAGHKDHAFAFITNQNVGETAEAWLVWWEQNEHKRQEAWVDDGFRQAGLTLHKPPTSEDITTLLMIIGIALTHRRTSGRSVHGPVPPDWLQLNANRFLRDHRIDPLTISGDMISSEVIRRGLVKYAAWRATHSDYGVGKASIDEDDWAEFDDLRPIILSRWVPWAAGGTTAAMLAIGWLGVAILRRVRKAAAVG